MLHERFIPVTVKLTADDEHNIAGQEHYLCLSPQVIVNCT